MSVPNLAAVRATLAAKAASLGFSAGTGVADVIHSYVLDIVAQGVYDHAAQFLDAAKQVVYDNDNRYPYTVASQASVSVAAGNTTFGPYTLPRTNERLFLTYWSSTNTAGMAIGPDIAGATGLALWIQRTAVANEFEVVCANNTGVAKNIEFAVMSVRFP